MLEFQNTKKAVFAPGAGSNYFDGLSLALSPFQISGAYVQTNAWWLAELSRVIYRLRAGEGGVVLPDRSTVLQNAGLREVEFFDHKQSTQASLIQGPGFHVLAFRGTVGLQDWLQDAMVQLDNFRDGQKVHHGFNQALDEVWPDVERALASVATPIFFTGHSLGAALATLAGARSTANPPLAVYAFGSPRVGNRKFAAAYPVRLYRVVNNRDLVTIVPPESLGYEHAGELHYITSDKRLLTNPSTRERLIDSFKDDDTHSLLKGDVLPEQIADHAPVNYVAWMQRFADPHWVARFAGR